MPQGRDRRATRHEPHHRLPAPGAQGAAPLRTELRPSLLDPHKAKIAELLALDAEAPATVVIDHLRRQGYQGGITILKDYLQRIRCEFLLAQGRQRTSYLPGEISHGDWWEPPLVIPVGKDRVRQVYGFVSTLPHCSAHAVVFSFHKRTPDFLGSPHLSVGSWMVIPPQQR